MSSGLYTVIVDFDGQTHGMQVFAGTLESILDTWLGWGARGGVPEHFSAVLNAVHESGQIPEEVESLQHVWSMTETVGEQQAFVHVVRTVEDDPF